MCDFSKVQALNDDFKQLAELASGSSTSTGRIIQLMRAGSNIRPLHAILGEIMSSAWNVANGIAGARMLMMAFAICYCPHVVFPAQEDGRPLSPVSHDSQQELEHMAQATIAALTELFPRESVAFSQGSTTVFRDRFHVFVHNFTAWKETDLEKIFAVLACSYRNVCDSLREAEEIERAGKNSSSVSEKTDTPAADAVLDDGDGTPDGEASSIIIQLRHERASLVSKAKSLGFSQAALEEWTPPSSPPSCSSPSAAATAPSRAAEEGIEDVIKRAFWDGFSDRLAAGDTDQLAVLLRELREKLKRLIPHRADRHAEFDDKIDPAFMQQLLQSPQSADSELFHTMTQFIVDQVVELDAPAETAGMQQWFAGFREDCHVKSYADLLPVFFTKMNTSIDRIQADCDRIRAEAIAVQQQHAEAQKKEGNMCERK
jgi:hypothetical protein